MAPVPRRPEELRQTSIAEFRHTMRRLGDTKITAQNKRLRIRVVDDEKDVAHEKASVATACIFESGPLFDIISDDAILKIVDFLMEIPVDVEDYQLLHRVDKSRRSLNSFMLSCLRISNIIKTIGAMQKAENHARAATKIFPAYPLSTTAFSCQTKAELVSCDQLRMMRSAHTAMACHCAKKCCLRIQKAFNRDIEKGRVFNRPCSPGADYRKANKSRLIPLMQTCGVLAPNEEGDVAYAYRRRTLSKVGVHGEERARRFTDEIVKLEIKEACGTESIETATLPLEKIDMSNSIVMRTSHDGSACAWICASADYDEEAFTKAYVWINGMKEPFEVGDPEGLGDPILMLQQGTMLPTLSPQDLWFARVPESNGGEAIQLVVAWSTEYIHPSGHFVGSNAGPGESAYTFATYTICNESVRFSVSTELNEGQLLSCHPTRAGTRSLALVKRKEGLRAGYREMKLHNLLSDTKVAVPFFNAAYHSVTGPLCVAMSPMGDSIVCVHKTTSSIVFSVLVRSGERHFCLVQTADLSAQLGLSPSSDAQPVDTDLVRFPYSLSYSPCGRFAAVLDTHPRFGECAPGHGLVVLDTALRMHKKKSLRPFPLFATDDQSPRSFNWTRSGIYLLPPGTDENGSMGSRGGALLLYAPETAGI